MLIVDYGIGNLGSIMNMLHRIHIDAKISSDPAEIRSADRLIFPGMGSFDKAMSTLDKTGLRPALEEAALDKKTPILGICLGMQLICMGSEEGELPGLGWVEANVKHFNFTSDSSLRIPHIGWNDVHITKNSPLLTGLTPLDRFYFAHSYHVADIPEEYVIGKTTYGYEFASIIQKGNIMAIQCHPERSFMGGAKLLSNFSKV
jgi:imidazole glycerol-phosphate synthase subunit HisH